MTPDVAAELLVTGGALPTYGGLHLAGRRTRGVKRRREGEQVVPSARAAILIAWW
jgi:hypothetical protein